jgi:Mrp family chromosome partitioning ATPase
METFDREMRFEMNLTPTKGIVIASTRSGVGKTTIA